MRNLILCSAVALLALNGPVTPAVKSGPPRIQAAILLDVSNSMDGLIGQARSELWKMVNELSRAKRDGQRATIEVALYEYGNSGLPESGGHLRRVVPFTTDLDRISEELFGLRTNGGDEWCGRVLAEADRGLEWSREDGDLKVVFIAGNEPFDQGPSSFRDAIGGLRRKGVYVSTIFCGDRAEGLGSHWSDGAALGKGSFLTIDQNQHAVHVAAPQDELIAKLGIELNETYVSYGTEGGAAAARQSAQDSNALSVGGGSFVNRAQVKASANYSNAHWDLVDACKEGRIKLAAVPTAQLPARMQGMSPEAREAFVRAQAARRADIQQRIKTLAAERERFLTDHQKSAAHAPVTLDAAMVESVRQLARDRGFSFE